MNCGFWYGAMAGFFLGVSASTVVTLIAICWWSIGRGFDIVIDDEEDGHV